MAFVFLFLTYFPQYNDVQIHPCCCKWCHSFFMAEQYFIVPHPFTHSFVNNHLFPCLAYCEQCNCKHRGTYIFLNYTFLQIYVQKWDCWIIWQLYFQFFKEPPYCFPQQLHQFTISPIVQEGYLFSKPDSAFICRVFFFFKYDERWRMYSFPTSYNETYY